MHQEHRPSSIGGGRVGRSSRQSVAFTRAVPDELQLWLFARARVVAGMHGGPWGTAIVMRGGQSAVEILTDSKHLKHDMQTRTF